MFHNAIGHTRPRVTPHRETVLRVLSELAGPATAHVIHRHARATGGRIGLSTVYRHLSSLTLAGIADVTRDPAGQHLYHLRSDDEHDLPLTCARCGRGTRVGAAAVARWAARTAALHGFTDVRVTAAVTGVCPLCPVERSAAPGG
ncbi:Fur family transcriptional regulator [Umezawaea beigongshangensis]|uniref:Fur family transcriptional regulator n=1 Tax=Umezawaea beigongshangensis TaxID=2780383 RepID=UPI0018F15669|nr:transcriptional repressor [Umezawaea beigongshangensis]